MDKINQLFIDSIIKAEKDNKKDYVIAGIWHLLKSIRKFYEMGFIETLVYQIALKKINFLMSAKTKTEIKEILHLSAPIYNGNKFVANGKFHVEEEELLLWSIASLKAPLSYEGYLRYQQLFHKYIS